MNQSTTPPTPQRGALWSKLVERSAAAQAGGHQHSLPTHGEVHQANELRYVVRVVDNLARKDRERTADTDSPAQSPFLPPEPALLVSDLSPTHFAVLNKFNVLDHHLLIVTRRFAEQEELLDADDFAALWQCLTDFPSLGFYNGGEAAGASQRHKHLQVIPLEPDDRARDLPWLTLYERNARHDSITRIATLDFDHALLGLSVDAHASPGAQLQRAYRSLIEHLGWTPNGLRLPHPYNLLVTPRWMALIPRTHEYWHEVSINALAFTGAFLVRTTAQARALVEAGPLCVLRSVCLSLKRVG